MKALAVFQQGPCRRSRMQTVPYIILILPAFIIFTLGIVIPLILGFADSLTDWNGLNPAKPFVGLKNYLRMFQDPHMRATWLFTAKFTIFNTVIQNVCAILLAVILDSGIKLKKTFRTIFFIPCLISPVIVGFVWLKMYGNVLPALCRALNLNMNVMLFGSGETVLTGLLIANNWQWIGYWSLIYLAALQSIPASIYEAATIDGAGTLKKFFFITLPMLAPAVTVCVVGITIGSIKVYDLLVSSTNGGPGYASTSIILYIYNTAIGGRQYSYGSALSMVLVAVLFLIAAVQVGILKKREVQI